jgi:hypothetical protein
MIKGPDIDGARNRFIGIQCDVTCSHPATIAAPPRKVGVCAGSGRQTNLTPWTVAGAASGWTRDSRWIAAYAARPVPGKRYTKDVSTRTKCSRHCDIGISIQDAWAGAATGSRPSYKFRIRNWDRGQRRGSSLGEIGYAT